MSHHPSDDEPRQPRGCACHFEMPGRCPGRHACPMCQEDAEPVRDLAGDLILWFGNDRERQRQLLEFLIDQCDLNDFSADMLLCKMTGHAHENLLDINGGI